MEIITNLNYNVINLNTSLFKLGCIISCIPLGETRTLISGLAGGCVVRLHHEGVSAGEGNRTPKSLTGWLLRRQLRLPFRHASDSEDDPKRC